MEGNEDQVLICRVEGGINCSFGDSQGVRPPPRLHFGDWFPCALLSSSVYHSQQLPTGQGAASGTPPQHLGTLEHFYGLFPLKIQKYH